MTAELQAGFGERKITPPPGVDLTGYGFDLDRRAERVLDDLWVRALVLKSGGRTLVLAGLDLLALPIGEADLLRGQIAAEHGLEREAVLLACSHTHSGPAAVSLPGLGSVDRGYLGSLREAVREAVAEAAAEARFAILALARETIEPLGYNRRTGGFKPIDPVLKAAYLRRKDRTIVLWSYACHAVVLGPETAVSGDWPGAAAREIGRRGLRSVFLQGFCGDIDPVTQANRWGRGSEDDLGTIGELVARRICKAGRFAAVQSETSLAAAEARISLPLRLLSRAEIDKHAATFAGRFGSFPGAARFAAGWRKRALERLPVLKKAPAVPNVPVQVLAAGPLRILAVPGEPFCETGLRLAAEWPFLMPVGYANGYVGYLPTRRAAATPGDYAAECAPMFVTLMPFAPETERIVAEASRRLLNALED